MHSQLQEAYTVSEKEQILNVKPLVPSATAVASPRVSAGTNPDLACSGSFCSRDSHYSFQ